MESRNISQIVEELVSSKSPQAFRAQLGHLAAALAQAPADPRPPAAKCHASPAAELAMRRAALSAATDSQQAQRNALVLVHYLVGAVEGWRAARLLALADEAAAADKALTKGERKYFLFTHLSLLVAFLPLCEDSGTINRVIEKVVQSVQGAPFGLMALSGLVAAAEAEAAVVPLARRVARLAGPPTFQALDFLLTAEQAVFVQARAAKDRELRKSLVELLKELTKKIRGLLGFGTLCGLLEAAGADPHFGGRLERLPTLPKIARFLLRDFASRGGIFAGLVAGFGEAQRLAREARERTVESHRGKLKSKHAKRGPERQKGVMGKSAEFGLLVFFTAALGDEALDLAELHRAVAAQPADFVALLGRSAYAGKDARRQAAALQRVFFARLAADPQRELVVLVARGLFLGEEWARRPLPRAAAALPALLDEAAAGELAAGLRGLAEGAADLDDFGRLTDKRIALACGTRSPGLREELLKELVGLYWAPDETAARLAAGDPEHSAGRARSGVQRAVARGLLPRLVAEEEPARLLGAARLWAAGGGEPSDVARKSLACAARLVGRPALAACLLTCLFQDHLSDEKDHASIVFNQVLDDLLLFGRKVAGAKEALGTEDFQILVDALLCLLSVENAALRQRVRATLEDFAEGLDDACLGLIEDAFFAHNEHVLADEDAEEDDADGSDIEIQGKLL